MARLTELADSEAEKIRGPGVSDMDDLLAAKRTAAKEYRDLIQHLAAHLDIPQGLRPVERNTLNAAARRLATAIRANAHALKAKLDADHALMRSIALAVEQRQTTGSGYLGNGSMPECPADRKAQAVLLNQIA